MIQLRRRMEKIGEAKAELEMARESLLESYFTQIRINYKTSDERSKNLIIKGLERLLVVKGHGFNGEKARKVRLGSNLTLKAMGNMICVNPIFINLLELGRAYPGNPTKGELTIKYLHWLKEHGYNPFGLSD